MIHPKQTINCKGKLLTLDQPRVMGILNVTPDSFFDGGQYDQIDGALYQAEKMIKEGADILDIGGMSSRPGAAIISVEEELKRVIPVIEAINKAFPERIISLDTVRAKVATEGIQAGAHLINDISAGAIDADMYTTVAALKVPYILMHMQGTPKTMQQNPDYEDVVQEVLDFFIQEVGKLRELEVTDIVVDPGFGFGKKLEHNYQLLKYMHTFLILDLPILTGLSRKSMINKVLGTAPKNALNGTTALHMVALQQGSKLLRVHDVKEAVQVIKLFLQLEEQ
ncbi:MAG: dihydropteroate synthase [Bacteroidota bacterium]